MKTYSIAEINDLDHGIPISRFEGRIKKVFEQKNGEGQYGTWYLQNLIVEDGQQEITVTWTGDDPFDAGVEGQVYSFETGYDKKEKPVGIVRDIRTKNGKKYEGVKVDNRSKIKREGQQGTEQGKMTNDEIDRTYERIDASKTASEPPPARSNGGGRVLGASGLDERQRAIIRQHSQSMALEVLKLKVTLNELTVEDLTPAKLRALADYFDQDALNAAQGNKVYGATQ